MSEIRSLRTGGEDRLAGVRPQVGPFQPEPAVPRDGFVPSEHVRVGPPADASAAVATASPVSDVPAAPAPAGESTTARSGQVPAAPNAPITLTIPPPTTPTTPTPPPDPAPPPDLPPGPPVDPGEGFPSAEAGTRTPVVFLRDLAAGRLGVVYDFVTSQVLKKLSASTERSVGVDLESLLDVDRTLYRALAPSREGYVGGQVPLFQALAEGQAAYVNLGAGRENDSEHIMRLFSGLPLRTIEKLQAHKPELGQVITTLIERKKSDEFPVFVDLDGRFDDVTGTESIAAESIASIARRENTMGSEFPDPRLFYRYLITRIESNWKRTDPWLYVANPRVHDEIGAIKDELTPPWIGSDSHDPIGFRTDPRKTQAAYQRIMGVAGGGDAPSLKTLTDFADLAIGLDRDLLSGIQTYWIKILRETGREQRETLLRPLARTWVVLNALASDDPGFRRVSPDDAPYIELVQRDGRLVFERYDRCMAVSEVVDHTLAGLGIQERKQFLDVLMDEIRSRADSLKAREDRIRARLGPAYAGLDVDAILNDPLAIEKPEVRQGLDQLLTAMHPERDFREMTPEYAELSRHRDMLKWIADRNLRYGDITLDPLCRHPSFARDPLIVGEFYHVNNSSKVGQVSTLPDGPQSTEVLGQAMANEEPVRMSLVLEGGGGKGFAYVESLRVLKESLRNVPGQVAIDEYVGTSAGAITAGLLATGYSEAELGDVMKRLDFKKFYADYLWLMGGVDPKVRGVDRTGVFSLQKMYRMLYDLLSARLGVSGRPVLFRDLPYKLKVVATALNTDLPQDLKDRLGIGKDGQITFSNETTPNMDVVAAICASAAVPGFFSAPQVQIARQTPDPDKMELYRLQLVDGGVVNNFPVAEAAKDGDKRMLVSVPTYFEAPPDTPGGKRARLTTLNFDPRELQQIDAYNRKRYAEFAPQLAQLIQGARGGGVDRVVMSMNLTIPEAQSAPALQGETRAATRELNDLARVVGMPVLSPKASDKLVRSNLNSKDAGLLQKGLIETFLDQDDTFDFRLCGPSGYNIPKDEAGGLSDLAIGVVAAKMSAPGELEGKLFEKG